MQSIAYRLWAASHFSALFQSVTSIDYCHEMEREYSSLLFAGLGTLAQSMNLQRLVIITGAEVEVIGTVRLVGHGYSVISGIAGFVEEL